MISSACYFDPSDERCLPAETLLCIFEYLDAYSAINLGLTCKHLQQSEKDPALWKFFYIREYISEIGQENFPESTDFPWKVEYCKKVEEKLKCERERIEQQEAQYAEMIDSMHITYCDWLFAKLGSWINTAS